jgi:hypothetical protein
MQVHRSQESIKTPGRNRSLFSSETDSGIDQGRGKGQIRTWGADRFRAHRWQQLVAAGVILVMVVFRVVTEPKASESAFLSENCGFATAQHPMHTADLLDDICDAIDTIVDILGGGDDSELAP